MHDLPEADAGRAKQHVSVNWLLADDVLIRASPAQQCADLTTTRTPAPGAQLGHEAVALGVLGQLPGHGVVATVPRADGQ